MPNWIRLANLFIKEERERILGIRREKIFFWGEHIQKWDEQTEKVWLRNRKGKEKQIIERTQGGES